VRFGGVQQQRVEAVLDQQVEALLHYGYFGGELGWLGGYEVRSGGREVGG
jgi:hypothetical protein